jgi:hypothetical protein
VSKDLLKNVGLCLVALLVVCNTYSIHTSSKTTKRTGGFGPRVTAHAASQRQQRPQAGRQRGHIERGTKGNKADWKQKKQQKPDAK